MTEEDKQAAAAYIKLNADVMKLILNTVADEVRNNPYGEFSMAMRGMINTEIGSRMQEYRIVQRGHTASY